MKRTLARMVASSAALLGLSGAAQADYEGYYSYAVKVLCGYYEPTSGYPVVAPGYYYTAVNVANPNNGTIPYQYKFVPTHDWPDANGEYETGGGEYGKYTGVEYDCKDLFERDDDKYGDYTSDEPPFYKGILYIWSEKRRLDVWGVYTARYGDDDSGGDGDGDDDGEHFEIDVEQVFGRKQSSKGWVSDLED